MGFVLGESQYGERTHTHTQTHTSTNVWFKHTFSMGLPDSVKASYMRKICLNPPFALGFPLADARVHTHTCVRTHAHTPG